MPHCRDCNDVLEVGVNWSPSLFNLGSRHCRVCASAYSRRRYRELHPEAKRRPNYTPEQRKAAQREHCRKYYDRHAEAIRAHNRAKYREKMDLLRDPKVKAAMAEARKERTPPTNPKDQ